MFVRIGNPRPIEHIRDSEGRRVTAALPPEGITEFLFPEGISIDDATVSVVDAMNYHMERDAKPVWIESDNKPLHKALCRHYSIKMTAKRPGDWGVLRVAPRQDLADDTERGGSD
jgi:hypothetical protein